MIPIHFTLPQLESKFFGICRTTYDLYGADNEFAQMKRECNEGRFAVYNFDQSVSGSGGLMQWFTVKDEDVFYNSPIEFIIHFKNNSDQPMLINIPRPFLKMGHDHSFELAPFCLTVPAQGSAEHKFNFIYNIVWASIPGYRGAETFRLQYVDTDDVIRQIGKYKVITIVYPYTSSDLAINVPGNVVGGSFDYAIRSYGTQDFVTEWGEKNGKKIFLIYNGKNL